eukprot:11112163-Karenia_brevis.AAC.1
MPSSSFETSVRRVSASCLLRNLFGQCDCAQARAVRLANCSGHNCTERICPCMAHLPVSKVCSDSKLDKKTQLQFSSGILFNSSSVK